MNVIELLKPLRARAGKVLSHGLSDATIAKFALNSAELRLAVTEAVAAFRDVSVNFPELMDQDEVQQIAAMQAGFVNFYAADNVNPYVAIAARGPWVITLKGAVLHDSGGYGMLGLGHAPQAILDVMAQPQVMANVMTASPSHLRLERALRAAIGTARGGCPYQHQTADRSRCSPCGQASATYRGQGCFSRTHRIARAVFGLVAQGVRHASGKPQTPRSSADHHHAL
jgi:hypothetical protein